MINVQRLWQEYQTEAEPQDQALLWNEHDGIAYRNGFTALSIAYFDAARILLSTVALELFSYMLD